MEDSDYNDTDEKRLTVVSSTKMVQKTGNHISRRSFTKSISHIVGLGVLGHFSLLANNLQAEEITNSDDECGSGLDIDDICNPPDNNDNCPGEEPPADSCPFNGNQPEDVCNTGGEPADQCQDAAESSSDQCESGMPADDYCSSSKDETDKCPSGQTPEDSCPPNGTVADGDACWGGSATTNGQTQDTCADDGTGDDCSVGSWHDEEDDCRQTSATEWTDVCIGVPNVFDADSCVNGTNTNEWGNNGGSDYCQESGVGDLGSDLCPSGLDADDICNGGSDPDDGLYDTCPGGGSNVDVCDPSVPSDDYCKGGDHASDECNPEVSEKDDCPGGKPDVDDCPGLVSPEDVCTAEGGCAGGDEEFPPFPDHCAYIAIDTCVLIVPDNAE